MNTCQALTKKGDKCKCKTKNQYCGRHLNQNNDVKLTITITFSDAVENNNNVGMEQIGEKTQGFTLLELENAKVNFETMGVECELINLSELCEQETEPAYLLIARKAINIMEKIDKNHDDMLKEHLSYEWDKTIYSIKHGRVVNKNKRHNVCYADYSQKADIENKKGTVVDFNTLPCTNYIRKCLGDIVGPNAVNLLAEGNKYYDINKTSIGEHGDFERTKVIAIRLGESFPLYYRWYLRNKPVSELKMYELNGGDLYIMSAKAVGTDWKKSSKLTLRHAAGLFKNIK
jgi:hypothetical protein